MAKTLKITSSPIKRTEKIDLSAKPKTSAEFKQLVAKASESALIKLGFRKFNKTLLLIPGELYDVIPNGFKVLDVFGVTEPFKKGVTDNDTRYGCLAFGIKRKIKKLK